jgi:hypothetical protein
MTGIMSSMYTSLLLPQKATSKWTKHLVRKSMRLGWEITPRVVVLSVGQIEVFGFLSKSRLQSNNIPCTLKTTNFFPCGLDAFSETFLSLLLTLLAVEEKTVLNDYATMTKNVHND